MTDALSAQARALAIPVLAQHGFHVADAGGQLLLAASNAALALDLHVLRQQVKPGLVVVESLLDVLPLTTSTPPRVRDQVAGYGDTLEEALADCLGAWAQGVLRPLADALLSHGEVPPAFRFGATPEGHSFDVFPGPLQVAGDARELELPWAEGFPFPTVAAALPAALHGAELHWLKVFTARLPGRVLGQECRLDSEEWPAGQALLQGVPWPEHAGYLGFKRFFVLRPRP